LSLRPETRERRQEPVSARFTGSEDSAPGLHLHRRPVSHVAAQRSRGGKSFVAARAGICHASLEAVQATGAGVGTHASGVPEATQSSESTPEACVPSRTNHESIN